MEGLVPEALKHTVEEAPENGPVLEAAIIAQYQRMTHYGTPVSARSRRWPRR